MNGLSPISVDTDWSPVGGYQPYSAASSNHPPNPNFKTAPDTPPVSSHTSASTTTTDGGMPGTMSRRRPSNGNPSPPRSLAGSVDSSRRAYVEDELVEHYRVLKNYLIPYLRDQPPNAQQNRAREKLVRLSSIQFQELSTDVYDELLRREDDRKRGGPGNPNNPTPRYLLPKANYHFKRNQARQKLSTLPPDRFRQLATDVFYELERRYPRFNGGGAPEAGSDSRVVSIAGSVASSLIPAPRADSRGPLDQRGQQRGPYRQGSPFGGAPGVQPGLDTPQSPIDYGRPMQKTFQQNTIVPNKGLLVEDDGASSVDEMHPSRNEELVAEYKLQVSQLEDKVDSLQLELTQASAELEKARSSAASNSNLESERSEWNDLRVNLEKKLQEALDLNDNLQAEVDRLRNENSTIERDLRTQLDDARRSERDLERDLRAQIDVARREARDLERELRSELEEARSTASQTRARSTSQNDERCVELERELDEQRRITEDVRRDAAQFLQDMRLMAQTSADALEKEERLLEQVADLEREVKEWKAKYAAAKTRERSLRASSLGLPSPGIDSQQYSQFMSPDGAVKDFHLTNYQLAIDELLQLVRKPDAAAQVVECMKQVVLCVRRISSDTDVTTPDSTPGSNSSVDSLKQQARLKMRLSQTANQLITAAKSHAAAAGLAPVSIVDAAASNLTAAVIDVVREMKIRSTPPEELERLEREEYEQIQYSAKPAPLGIRGKSSTFSGDSTGLALNGANGVNGGRNGHVRNGSSISSAAYSVYSRYSRYSQSVNGDANSAQPNGLKPNGLGVSGVGMGMSMSSVRESSGIEEFKNYLEDSTAVLVRSIQPLVNTIRGGAATAAQATIINNYIADIAATVTEITARTADAVDQAQSQPANKAADRTGKALVRHAPPVAAILEDCKAALIRDGLPRDQVPPIAFRIARATKELVLRVDRIESGDLTADMDLPTEV